jgi:hypothetical protein
MNCEVCDEYIEMGTDDNYNTTHTRIWCPDCGSEYIEEDENKWVLVRTP